MSVDEKSDSSDSSEENQKIDDLQSLSSRCLLKTLSENEDLKGTVHDIPGTSYGASYSADSVFLDLDVLESSSAKIKSSTSEKVIVESEEVENLPCSSCEFIEPVQRIETFYCWCCCKRRKPWKKISEYLLVSVPKKENTWEDLNAASKKLSENYKFHTPMFKVGILNKLLEMTGHLKTLDKFVKEVIDNLLPVLKTELGNDLDQIEENLKVNNLSPATFLTRFTWNQSKYPSQQQISMIADQIYCYLNSINDSIKEKLSLLEKINSSIQSYELRDTEGLQKRYLGDIVRKEHFVCDSRFLTTLLVIVPNTKRKQWETSYSSLSEMVVPNSSTKIFDDGTYSLYNVALSKNSTEQFKINARENDFIVREYKYSEENQSAEKKYFEALSITKTNFKTEIFKWAKMMFSEAFEAWIHVKALRVFVESVTRYGLPVNYQAMLLHRLKSKKKLKKILNELYKDIDTSLAIGNLANTPKGLAAYYDVDEYYPYVYFNINLDFLYS